MDHKLSEVIHNVWLSFLRRRFQGDKDVYHDTI